MSFVGHDAGTGIAPTTCARWCSTCAAGSATTGPASSRCAGVAKDRPLVVVATNEPARRWGVKAGDLVQVAAQILGGGGGGKDDVAQGGGTDATKVAEALARVEHAVGERVTAGR